MGAVPDEPAMQPDPRRRWALIVVLFAAFMDLLDSTIVNVAIPPIQHDLGASYASMQWVVAGYLLAFAVLLVTGGRMGDIFGRKRMFMVGVGGFTVASALCGWATDTDLLIAARVLQGLAAACMVPQVLSIITVTFPPKERGAALGAFGGVAGLATVGGPIAGALLTDADVFGLGWRAVFLINIPVGIALLIAASVVLRESRSAHRLRLDWVGTVLLATGLLLILVPLVQGREQGWPTWSIISMVASIPTLLAFVAYEQRRSNRDLAPLLPLKLFRSRSYTAGLMANLIFFAVVTGYFLVFTIYLQVGLGFSVLRAGLTGIPWSFGVSFGAAFSATVLTAKLGRRVLTIGAILLALGLGGIALTVRLLGTDVGTWWLLPTLLVGGLGMGMIVAPILDFILTDVPAEDAGAGSGAVNAVQQIGGAVGVALIGAVFFSLLGPQATNAVDQVTPSLRSNLSVAGMSSTEQEAVLRTFGQCFTQRTRDPEALPTPASCVELEAASGTRGAAAVSAAAVDARKLVSGNALQRTLLVQIAMTILVFLLVLRLPRKPRHHEEALAGEHAETARD